MIGTILELVSSETPVSERLRGLLTVDLKPADRVLTLLLTGIVIYLFVETLRYPWEAQLTPFFVLGTLIVLLFLMIVRQAGLLGDPEPVLGEPDSFVGGFGHDDEADGDEFGLYERRVELVKTCFWVLFLFIGSWLFGLELTGTVFLLVFLRYEGQLSWTWTVVITVAVMGFITVIFQEFLGGALYPGIFEIRIIDPLIRIDL